MIDYTMIWLYAYIYIYIYICIHTYQLYPSLYLLIDLMLYYVSYACSLLIIAIYSFIYLFNDMLRLVYLFVTSYYYLLFIYAFNHMLCIVYMFVTSCYYFDISFHFLTLLYFVTLLCYSLLIFLFINFVVFTCSFHYMLSLFIHYTFMIIPLVLNYDNRLSVIDFDILFIYSSLFISYYYFIS